MPISGVSSNHSIYALQQAKAQQLQTAQQAQQTQQAQPTSAVKDHDNDQGNEAAEGRGRQIDLKG